MTATINLTNNCSICDQINTTGVGEYFFTCRACGHWKVGVQGPPLPPENTRKWVVSWGSDKPDKVKK